MDSLPVGAVVARDSYREGYQQFERMPQARIWGRRMIGDRYDQLPGEPSEYSLVAAPAVSSVARVEARKRLREHFAAHIDVAKAEGEVARAAHAALLLSDVETLYRGGA